MKKIGFYPFAIIILSVIPLFDFFTSGLPITHDGQDHVARIANFYQNLQDGNFIPRWAPNLNWGYGHPILMFLYPLPSYIASLFHFFGFSFVDSTKLVFVVAYIASGLAIYLWIKTFLGEKVGLVAALLYLFAPYRFVDIYVRGAIGEHVAFIFPPLLCYFLLKLSQKQSAWCITGASLSVAMLVLSHNAISLMFLPIIFLYVVYLASAIKKKAMFLKIATIVFLLGFGMGAFFWIPAFFEGKYTLRDIVTKNGSYASSFSSLPSFFYGQWNYGGTGVFTVQIGIIQWIVVVASIGGLFLYYRKQNTLWKLTVAALFIFFVTLWLMTESSVFVWKNITILQKFQFPWRLLSVEVFIASLLGGVAFSILKGKTAQYLLILIMLFLLYVNKDFWHAKGYLQKSEAFYTSIYNGTTDTGESAPIWSVRFMEKEPKSHLEIISGKGTIIEVERKSTRHVYVAVLEEASQIRENTLYFPGWNVFVDGQKVPIEFQNPAHRGLLTFFVDKGKHSIDVIFTDTKVRLLANSISVISFIIVGIILIVRSLLWQRFRLF